MAAGKQKWEHIIMWPGVSRRRVLQGATLSGAGLVTAAILGCGRGERPVPPSGAPSAAQPKRGGILTRLTATDGVFNQGLDPHKTGGSEAGLMNLWYQTLVRLHPVTAEVEAELAQKWEQPTPTEYIFRLAPNILWHDKPPVNGRPLTAQDVAFSLNRARTPEPLFVNRSLLNQIDKIEAVDTSTVRVTTKVPDVTTLLNLGDLTMHILAPEVVERFDKLTAPEHAIGTGAFILQAMDDTSATTVRNPRYWKAGLPYLDGVRLVHIPDLQVAYAAFLSGQLDVTQIPGEESKRFLAERGRQYNTGWSPGVNCFLLSPNTSVKPFDDPRVVRAMRLLTDHQEGVTAWAEVFYGAGTSYTLPHAMESWDLTPAEYAQILEWKQPKDEAAREALALLSAAGYNRSNPLKFSLLNSNIPTGRASAQIVQSQWQRFSQGVVQVDLVLVDNATSRTRQSRGEFEHSGPIGRGSYWDPDQFLTQTYHSKGSVNFTKWGDPKLDEMIERQRTIFDVTQRKALVREIVKFLIDNAPQTNFASRDILNATQPKVRDFIPEPGRQPGWQYERLWFDT